MARSASQQLGLYAEPELERAPAPTGRPTGPRVPASAPRPCAGCRAKEARYGFRPDGVDDPTLDRPRTLCFECFRVELTRRQDVREHMARGWNAHQVGLPLGDTLRALDLRRRRAQIAARHALGVQAISEATDGTSRRHPGP
jgi:hypothetical protein